MLDDLIAAVAVRNGLRETDYSFEWDGGQFDPALNIHRLTITTTDGRKILALVNEMVQGNPAIAPIEAAFASFQSIDALRSSLQAVLLRPG